jgi:hypothetical protein
VEQGTLNLVLGGSVTLSMIALMVVIFIQTRQVGALTNAMKEINANPRALDLVEAAATKVVPTELATGLIQLLNAGQSFAPDPQVKDFLSQLETFVKSVTDGKPNDPSSPGIVAPVNPPAPGSSTDADSTAVG